MVRDYEVPTSPKRDAARNFSTLRLKSAPLRSVTWSRMVFLRIQTASPATCTCATATAHTQMRDTREVALHLPYLWCERRTTPGLLQPTRRLVSASSRSSFNPGRERGGRDYGDLFPLLSTFSSFLSAFSLLFDASGPVLSSSSRVWRQFTDMWDKTGSVEQDRNTGCPQSTSPLRNCARATDRGSNSGGFC